MRQIHYHVYPPPSLPYYALSSTTSPAVTSRSLSWPSRGASLRRCSLKQRSTLPAEVSWETATRRTCSRSSGRPMGWRTRWNWRSSLTTSAASQMTPGKFSRPPSRPSGCIHYNMQGLYGWERCFEINLNCLISLVVKTTMVPWLTNYQSAKLRYIIFYLVLYYHIHNAEIKCCQIAFLLLLFFCS